MRRPARFAAALALIAAPALAAPPKVVADIAPVQSLVAQVMTGLATPVLLLGQEASPHTVQLRPSQARALSDADLVVWVGPELEPWLDSALAGLGHGEGLVLLTDAATHLRNFGPGEADDDDAAGGIDPHAWLSPDNARAWLGAIAEALAARDPENAATYRANAAAAQGRIDALKSRITARLAPHRGAEIVTFHAAFGYFADAFGLRILGSVRSGDAAPPSAASLAELRAQVAADRVSCAFSEPAYDPALLASVAGKTGLRLGEIDPIGAAFAPGPEHYAQTLEAIGNAIADCLDRK